MLTPTVILPTNAVHVVPVQQQPAALSCDTEFVPSDDLKAPFRTVRNPLSNSLFSPDERIRQWLDGCRAYIQERYNSANLSIDAGGKHEILLDVRGLLTTFHKVQSGEHPDIARLRDFYRIFEDPDLESRRRACFELESGDILANVPRILRIARNEGDLTLRIIALRHVETLLGSSPGRSALPGNPLPQMWQELDFSKPSVECLRKALQQESPYRPALFKMLSTHGLNSADESSVLTVIDLLSGLRDSSVEARLGHSAVYGRTRQIRAAAKKAFFALPRSRLSALNERLLYYAYCFRKLVDDWYGQPPP